jgi:hypothetical protein
MVRPKRGLIVLLGNASAHHERSRRAASTGDLIIQRIGVAEPQRPDDLFGWRLAPAQNPVEQAAVNALPSRPGRLASCSLHFRAKHANHILVVERAHWSGGRCPSIWLAVPAGSALAAIDMKDQVGRVVRPPIDTRLSSLEMQAPSFVRDCAPDWRVRRRPISVDSPIGCSSWQVGIGALLARMISQTGRACPFLQLGSLCEPVVAKMANFPDL